MKNKKIKYVYVIQERTGEIWFDLYKERDLDYIKKFYKALVQKNVYLDYRIIKVICGKD